MKVISIIGARPQLIKVAMVSHAIREKVQEIILHTGQHYDDNMSQIFFEQLHIPTVDIHLGIGGGSHAEQTGAMMIGIEKVIQEQNPQAVIVYGDTNSTLAGAVTAAKCNIPIIHVEAGLRSFNRCMPEEINRIIADRLSQVLFCPTQSAVQNLSREGLKKGVFFVGDVMYDALLSYLPQAQKESSIFQTLQLQGKIFALVTIHRAANTDDTIRLSAIIEAIGKIRIPVVFPIHPRTKKMLQQHKITLPENIISIEPVGYLDMLTLEAHADCILTDSGGVQKEAYWLGVRCITLRDETEWTETVECGWNKLLGVNIHKIISAIEQWHPSEERLAFYGDGNAAQKIRDIIFTELS